MLECAVLGAARAGCVAELLQVGDAMEMNESPGNDQDMEQLVGVKLQRKERERETEKERRKSAG